MKGDRDNADLRSIGDSYAGKGSTRKASDEAWTFLDQTPTSVAPIGSVSSRVQPPKPAVRAGVGLVEAAVAQGLWADTPAGMPESTPVRETHGLLKHPGIFLFSTQK